MPISYCVTLWPSLNCCTFSEHHLCFLSSSLKIYDDELRATVCSSFNIQLAESDPSWIQSTLPVCHGGLGIRSAVQPAPSAFLASAAASSGLAHLILPANMQPPQLSYVDEALAAWSQGCQEQPPTDAAAHHDSENMGLTQSIFYCRYTIYRLI